MPRKRKKINKRSSKNKFKKFLTFSNIMNIIYLILILAVIGFAVYANQQGWISFNKNWSTINNSTIINYLNTNQQSGSSCQLLFTPTTITKGDTITGNLNNGANSYCAVFAYDGTEWKMVYEGYTNEMGKITQSIPIYTEGIFTLRAICDENSNGVLDTEDCLTNSVTVTVQNGTSSDCVDSDGRDRYTAGNVLCDGVRYYDDCLDVGAAVTEFTCVGGTVFSENLMCDYGEECFQTRSGGYCRDIVPSYSPGDVIYSQGGSSGITGGTLPVVVFPLTGFTPGGDCTLGVKFTTDWHYSPSESTCYNQILGVLEGVKWDIYDSNGLEYTRSDLSAMSKQVDLHPSTHIWNWDGQTEWRVMVTEIGHVEGCSELYTWELEVYVYDC